MSQTGDSCLTRETAQPMTSRTALAVFCSAAILAFSLLAPARADDERPYRVLSLSGTG